MENPLKKVEQEIEQAVDKVEDVVSDLTKKVKKPWYKKIHGWILIVFLIVIVIGGLIYYSTYTPVKNSIQLAQQVQASFEKAQADLLAADFEAAKKDIQTAQRLLEKLDQNVSQLDSPLMIGYLRNQYNAVENIVAATQEFSDGLYLLTTLAQDVLENIEMQQGNLVISAEQREQILEKFSKKTPELNGAKAQIDLSLLELDNISVNKLNSTLAEYVVSLRIKMSLLRNFLDKSISLSQALPEILGLNSEKTYLFILQNSNELRPTGGFIGTIGILKIRNGEIISLKTDNVYDYDKYAHEVAKVSAPEPLVKYLNIDGWYLRDSNWSPDFVESAKQIEYFFHREANLTSALQDYNFNGVIATTPKVIEDFLGIVGAVEIDSFVFNKDNFIDRLQYLVEVGYEEQGVEYWQRKNIIGNLANKLVERTQNLNLNGWVEIFKSIFDNLNQKHLLVYSKNPNVQILLEDQNWSGKIQTTQDDFLMVVDANLAALKSNQCVERKIKYSVIQNSDEDLISKVNIYYKNNCNFTWKSTRYRTYTRAYVPQGSELIKTTGAMEIDRSNKTGQTDVYQENNKTVFGAFISIEPEKSGTLSFEYKLPNQIADKIFNLAQYNLYLQKQPGTLKDDLNLDLKFIDKIRIAQPAEARIKWGDKQYQITTNLEQDREVKVGF